MFPASGSAPAGPALQFSPVDDNFAPAYHRLRPALYLKPFKGRVVDIVMENAVGDGDAFFRIPEGEVGIRPDRDCALARVKSVELRVIRGGQGDEAWQVDAPLGHTLAEQDGEARLQAGYAIGDGAEGGAGPALSLPSLSKQ